MTLRNRQQARHHLELAERCLGQGDTEGFHHHLATAMKWMAAEPEEPLFSLQR